MPLILAIEPDSRQASLVSDLARGLASDAELVLTASASEAIHEMDARVPDLILTSTLLSPADESLLTDRLRRLDSAGAHVQTLVIPLLAEPQTEPEPQPGLLSRFSWKKKKASAPDGCDPSVFGGQITEYLNRAYVLRRAFTGLPSPPLGDEGRSFEEPLAAAASAPVLLPPSDLVREAASPLADLLKVEEPLLKAEDPVPVEEILVVEPPAAVPVEPLFTLEEALVDFEMPAPPEPRRQEPLVTDIDALSAELDAVLAAHASSSGHVEPLPLEPLPVEAFTQVEPAVLDDAPEAFIVAGLPEPVAPVAEPADAAFEPLSDSPFRTDLLELLAAIQLDLEPLRSAPDVRSAARMKAAGGIQDEWGFFDPQQCGMAALLARLDEMALQHDAGAGRA